MFGSVLHSIEVRLKQVAKAQMARHPEPWTTDLETIPTLRGRLMVNVLL